MWADRPSTLWIIVISVNRENRDCDVEIAVLIVDSWKSMETERTAYRKRGEMAYEKPAAFPSVGSLRSSI